MVSRSCQQAGFLIPRQHLDDQEVVGNMQVLNPNQSINQWKYNEVQNIGLSTISEIAIEIYIFGNKPIYRTSISSKFPKCTNLLISIFFLYEYFMIFE